MSSFIYDALIHLLNLTIMRTPYSLLTAVGLLIPSLLVLAQTKTPIETTSANQNATLSQKDLDQLPFAKGNWEYRLMKNVGTDYQNNSEGGQSLGHQDEFNLNLGANYYFADGLAAGLNLESSWKEVHTLPDISTNTNKWMINADFKYGVHLSPNFNIFGMASVGVGTENTTDKSAGNSTSFKDNLFDYKLTVGAPFRVFGTAPIYLTPQVSWDHLSTSFDGGKEIRSGLRVGLDFETYLGRNDFYCDHSHGFNLSKNIYEPGTSFLEFSTGGQFAFGTLKTTYSGSGSEQQENYSNECLDFCYGNYILPYFAVGAGFRFGGTELKDKESDDKTTTGKWMFSPMVVLNAPVDNGWNNSFLQFKVGFGAETNTSSGGTNSSTEKNNIFGYSGMFGYNDLVARKVAITAKIGYEWNSFKNTDTDTKQKSNGPAFEMGTKFIF
jgi:hypothetical protein